MSDSSKPNKYYAVVKGKKEGIFNEPWSVVSTYVTGYKGQKYKSFDTMDEAVIWYQKQQASQNVPRGGVVIYTDGSNTSDGNIISYGYIIGIEDSAGKMVSTLKIGAGLVSRNCFLGKKLSEEEWKQVKKSRNVTGELVAVYEALKEVHDSNLLDGRVIVCHDYIGASSFIDGSFDAKTPITRLYHDTVGPLVQDYDIEFVHVKGHTNIAGNETADTLAAFMLGRANIKKTK